MRPETERPGISMNRFVDVAASDVAGRATHASDLAADHEAAYPHPTAAQRTGLPFASGGYGRVGAGRWNKIRARMENRVHKVFVSYHHDNDQSYKEALVTLGERNEIFIDQSVDTGDISDDLSDEYIRELIRDGYLRDSTVTIVLVGTETRGRKHVDWEIYSSMYDGPINKKSGILVVELPEVSSGNMTAPRGEDEKELYSDITSWTTVNSRAEYERRYP